MKKVILFVILITFISFQSFAQKTITFAKVTKKFAKKYDFLDLQSWEAAKKGVYSPTFSETYYEITATEVIENTYIYFKTENVYNASTMGKMTYTDKMIYSYYVAKYPLSAFDVTTEVPTIKKDENKDTGSNEVTKKIYQIYKKPFYKISADLNSEGKYTFSIYGEEGDPEIETREYNGVPIYFKFNNEKDAKAFLTKFLAAVNKK